MNILKLKGIVNYNHIRSEKGKFAVRIPFYSVIWIFFFFSVLGTRLKEEHWHNESCQLAYRIDEER